MVTPEMVALVLTIIVVALAVAAVLGRLPLPICRRRSATAAVDQAANCRPTASDRTSATYATSSSGSTGENGSAKVEAATRSVTGKSPSRKPKAVW